MKLTIKGQQKHITRFNNEFDISSPHELKKTFFEWVDVVTNYSISSLEIEDLWNELIKDIGICIMDYYFTLNK